MTMAPPTEKMALLAEVLPVARRTGPQPAHLLHFPALSPPGERGSAPLSTLHHLEALAHPTDTRTCTDYGGANQSLLVIQVETTPTEKMARLPAEKEDGPARCEDWCEEEEEETSNDLSNLDIVTKYRTSGDIANRALAAVAAACVPGAKAVDLCNIGDAYINEAVSKIYNQKKEGKKLVEKGVAFPTCVSVNNCVGHYSPLTSEDKVVLEDGDMVKIDLGVHVDGYVAVVAHTVLVGEQDVSGRKGDVLMAAWTAGEVAQRMLKDGATNNDISQAIAKVAESYQCSPVEGVLSHQMKKHVIDANKKIINKITPEQQVPKATITKNDVFAIDVVMSTGEGKPKQVRSAEPRLPPCTSPRHVAFGSARVGACTRCVRPADRD